MEIKKVFGEDGNSIFNQIYNRRIDLCEQDVGGGLKDEMDEDHILYYISESPIPGFALIQELPPDTYFLDTICT